MPREDSDLQEHRLRRKKGGIISKIWWSKFNCKEGESQRRKKRGKDINQEMERRKRKKERKKEKKGRKTEEKDGR